MEGRPGFKVTECSEFEHGRLSPIKIAGEFTFASSLKAVVQQRDLVQYVTNEASSLMSVTQVMKYTLQQHAVYNKELSALEEAFQAVKDTQTRVTEAAKGTSIELTDLLLERKQKAALVEPLHAAFKKQASIYTSALNKNKSKPLAFTP